MSIEGGGFCCAPTTSFAFVYRNLLGENKRDTVNIVIPDVEPSILKKVVEYIYFGTVELEPKFMAGENPLKLLPLSHNQIFHVFTCRFH